MSLSSARIAVIDSNRLFRAGLVSLLTRESGRTICEAASVDELQMRVVAPDEFDLVLLELCPDTNSATGNEPCPVSQIRKILPDARVTMLADDLDADQLRTCFAAGADGYLLKNISSETLLASLKLIQLGEKIFPSPLADLITHDGNGMLGGGITAAPASVKAAETNLSEREIEILRCLVAGDSNKRIANRLNIAEATVKVHLKSILRKTRAMNRTQAAIWALQRGVSGLAAAALLQFVPLNLITSLTNTRGFLTF